MRIETSSNPEPQKEIEIVRRSLEDIINNNFEFLKLYNLEAYYDPKLSLLYFTGINGSTEPKSGARIINIKNVRLPIFNENGEPSNEVIYESVPCIGIYIPDTDEIAAQLNTSSRIEVKKRAYHQSIEMLKAFTQPRSEQSPSFSSDFYIAVATRGQISLWQKLGFFDEIKPSIEGGPPLLKIINTLFFNDFQPLNDLGIRFRTRGAANPEMDILFYTRDEKGIAHHCSLNLLGLDRSLAALTEYENVVGLISVPNEMSLSERKKITRQATRLLGYWLHDPNVNVITVDENLIGLWLEHRRILANTENHRKPRKKIDYGYRFQRPQHGYIVLFEPKAQIGGPQLLIDLLMEEEISSSLILDWGLPYLDEALMNLGNRPNYANGLNPFFRNRMLPEIRRLYRRDLLVNSLTPQMIDVVLSGEYSFILGELYHRLGEEQLLELIESRFPYIFQKIDTKKFIENLKQIENKYYRDKRIFEGVAISHGHTDHFGGLFSVRYDVPAFMSPETYTFIKTRFHQPGSWLDEYVTRRVREEGKKNPYDLEKRVIKFLKNEAWERVAPFFSILSFPVDHSIIGAQGFIVAVTDNSGKPLYKICYLTDFRDGDLTKASIEIIKSNNPDFLIIEGTNLAQEKLSSQISESTVKDNIAYYLEEAGKKTDSYFIVEIPLNHIERLNNLVEIASSAKSKRKVAIPLAMAQIIHEFYILNENLPKEQKIKLPQLNQDIILYYQNKTKYDPWEQQLIAQYNGKSITELALTPGEFIFVKSPYVLLENLFAGVIQKDSTGYIVRSTYWPYDDLSKSTVLSNYRFATANGLTFLSDIDLSRNRIIRPDNITGFHASGHGNDEFLLYTIDQIAQSGNLKYILPIHTEFRGKYAMMILEGLRRSGISIYPEGTRVISRVSKSRRETIPIF